MLRAFGGGDDGDGVGTGGAVWLVVSDGSRIYPEHVQLLTLGACPPTSTDFNQQQPPLRGHDSPSYEQPGLW